MAQTSQLLVQPPARRPLPVNFVWRIAWRNLWRNPRRTWLTSGAIAFACLLVSSAMALQEGVYDAIYRAASSFLVGQIEISSPAFIDDQALEHTLPDATQLLHDLRRTPTLQFAPRVQAYSLVSAGERAFGAAIFGVDFAAEVATVTFFDGLQSGHLPQNVGEAVIGVNLARNLNVALGDEVLVLGNAKQGGVAAMALTVSGIFASGQVEIDRTTLFARLAEVQSAYALGDEVHSIAVRTPTVAGAETYVADLQALLPAGALARSWRQVLTDVVQGTELDRVAGQMMYALILMLVSFSAINTFLMIIFERTREFGTLLAIGMHWQKIMTQILAEALFVWGVGVAVGVGLAIVVVQGIGVVGIPTAGFEEVRSAFYLGDRLYPALTLASLTVAPLVLLVGTQLAALLTTMRLRRLRPVVALRTEG